MEVTLHEVQQHDVNTKPVTTVAPQTQVEDHASKTQARTANTPRKRDEAQFAGLKMINDVMSLPLKPVDLNKSLDIISPVLRKRQNTGKKDYPSLKHNLDIKTNFIHKRDIYDRPTTHHLPLKEAYLKPDTLSAREQASRQHHDKTTRIIKWLRNLNYLDEKAVQRGRIEVEKTHYELPEIKVPVY